VIGGVVVGLALGQYNPRRRVGAVMVASLAVSALALFLTGILPPTLPLAAGAWFLAGAGLTAFISGSSTFLWGYVPADRLARVTSNLYVFRGTSAAVGVVVLGVLATDLVPSTVAYVVALVFGASAVASLLLPACRKFAF